MWQTLKQVLETLVAAHPTLVAAALALYMASWLAAGARWHGILRSLGCQAAFARTVLINLAGIFVNNTTPASRLGGEACRVALLQREPAVTLRQATLSVGCDRASDLPLIALLAGVSLPAVRGAMRTTTWRFGLAAVAAGGAVAAAYCWRRRRRRTSGRQDAAPRRWLWIAECRPALPAAVCWSGIIWIQDVVRLVAVAAACGVSLTLSQAAALSIVAVLGGLAPTVGGLGIIEAGLLGSLLAFGIRPDAAGAIVALERAISYGVGTLAGGIAASYLGGRLLWTVSRSRSSATGSPRE